jgi:hypothetical protein
MTKADVNAPVATDGDELRWCEHTRTLNPESKAILRRIG